MVAFLLAARLHLAAQHRRALSLPQSFCAAKRRKNPAPSSEGAEAAPPHTAEFTAVGAEALPRRAKICNCASRG